jgi:hypothetical protein
MQGILGVIDGVRPLEFENDDDKKKRHEFLRMIGEATAQFGSENTSLHVHMMLQFVLLQNSSGDA